jgi:hypothetical protein
VVRRRERLRRCPGRLSAQLLSRKTTINTGVHLAAAGHEVLLHRGELLPNAIRNELSPLFTRFETAKLSAAAPPAVSGEDP